VTATQPALSPDISVPTVNKPARRSSFPLLDLATSAVGKKWIMAISGLAMMGFVFAHMVGNLKLYLGQVDFDHYAEFLRQLLVPILPEGIALWLMRIGLLAAFGLHIWSAASLTMMNRRAKPVRYERQDYIAANFAARTMRLSGIVVFFFIVFHLADLTWGVANPDYVYGNAYDNVVASFQRVPVAAFYVIAMVFLGLHLFHGTWSIFQTVGSMSPHFNPKRNPLRKGIAAGFAILVAGANISFPLAVQFGIIG